MKKTVLLGLSGGVDSSVAALILKKQGYRVIGAFMKNFSDTKNKITGECAWREERKIAIKIASLLDIEFITLDFEEEYKTKVIDSMFKDYSKGLTPNPDILCNKIIKFPLLWQAAKKLGADHIATGHYARINQSKRGFELYSGKDKEKDQSYFLAELSQKDLEHTIFPLGNYTKSQVREIAKKNKFPNWDKQGSRGICFVGKTNMRKFLGQKIKEKKGKIVSPEGEILGEHPGIMFYTIGQKVVEHAGLRINKPKEFAQKRWYVAQKQGNVLVVAPADHSILKKKEVVLKKLHLINPKQKIPKNLKARIRYRGELGPGKLQSNKWVFNKPVNGVAKGQVLVLYSNNKLVGCGEII